MKELDSKLLDILFNGNYTDLRSFIKMLTQEDKKSLFKDWKTIIKTLKTTCKYEPDSFVQEKTAFGFTYKPRTKGYKTLYQTIKDNFDNLAEIIAKEKINFFGHTDTYTFFTKLQIILVGISDKKSITSGIKLTRTDPISYDAKGKNSYIYVIGSTLLEREEEWKKEVLVDFFENIEKYFNSHYYYGLTNILFETIELYKDEKELFETYIGKAMYFDSFRLDRNYKKFKPEHILKSLAYYPSDERLLSSYPPVFTYNEKDFISLIQEGYLPREATLVTILEQLLKPLKNSFMSSWNKIYTSMNISDEDILNFKSYYLNLLNASHPTAIQIGLEGVKKILTKLDNEKENLVATLAFNLNNSVQKVAKESFTLLKTLYKQDKKLSNNILEQLLNNITTPHKNLRIEMVKWLADKNLSKEQKQNIQEALGDNIDSVEKAILNNNLQVDNKEDKKLEILENKIKSPNNALEYLKELILKVKTKDNSKYTANSNKLANILEKFITTNKILEQEKIVVNFDNYHYDKKITLIKDEILLAEFFAVKFAKKHFKNFEMELIIASILETKKITNIEKVTKLLDPCLKFVEKIKSFDEKNGFSFNITPEQIILALLAYMWLNNGIALVLSPENPILKYSWLSNHDNNIIAKLTLISNLLKQENKATLLSTPSYEAGWLEPEVFAERFNNLPKTLIDYDDLFLALFRLAPNNKESAWNLIKHNFEKEHKKTLFQKLKGLVGGGLLESFKLLAVVLALAPKEEATEALNKFIEYFNAHNPTDIIVVINNHSVTEDANQLNNRIFRLFNSALRSRFLLSNPLEEFPELSNLNLNNLILNLGIDYSIQKKHIDAIENEGLASITNISELTSVFIDSLKLNTFSRHKLKEKNLKDASNEEKDFFTKLLFEVTPLTFNSLVLEDCSYVKDDLYYYPHLSHYYAFLPSANYKYMPSNAINKTFRFPAIAQRLFEVSLLKEKELIEGYNFYIDFIALATLPYINIGYSLKILVKALLSKKQDNREILINLFIEILKDGRATCNEFIEAFSLILKETKGFKYVMEAVNALIAHDNYYEKLFLLTIEAFIAESNTSKNLSTLLDLMVSLLEKNTFSFTNEKTRAFLEDCKNSKKKNNFKDKATVILSLQQKTNIPTIIDIYKGILEDNLSFNC